MLRVDNTAGFSQADLDKMNGEVQALLDKWQPEIERHGIDAMTKYAEEKILKKYGGA